MLKSEQERGTDEKIRIFCTCGGVTRRSNVLKAICPSPPRRKFPMESSEVTTPSESVPGSNYETGIQSFQSFQALPLDNGVGMEAVLKQDLTNRVCQAGDNLISKIFPDEAFGFSINEKFAENFYDRFLTRTGTIDKKVFKNESTTATFLNKVINDLDYFLNAANQKHLKLLRYFSSAHSNIPIRDALVDRKPDIMLVRLVDEDYTREGPLDWKDVQALIEHTISKDPPPRMGKTITDKNYLMFCAQPERNFIINICIINACFAVIVSDHVGQIETDLFSSDRSTNVLLFLRIVMGFAFLPDKWLGIDNTIIRRVHGQKSSIPRTFKSSFKKPMFPDPKIDIIQNLLLPLNLGRALAVTKEEAVDDECPDFDTISIRNETYKVLSVLFDSQAFIGRATKVFLVRFPDGRKGVLKDSFITTNRMSEQSILDKGPIPFGPEMIDHCTFDDTNIFRKSLFKPAATLEVREKRRVVTYPAGVHISDFSSLWELMVAFLDVAVGMSRWVINSPCSH